jgi:hypothetical protein
VTTGPGLSTSSAPAPPTMPTGSTKPAVPPYTTPYDLHVPEHTRRIHGGANIRPR